MVWGRVRLADNVVRGGVQRAAEDHGSGILEFDREFVLEQVLRLPGREARLKIVAVLSDRYNGQIVIINSVLGGVRVIVSFPLAWTASF